MIPSNIFISAILSVVALFLLLENNGKPWAMIIYMLTGFFWTLFIFEYTNILTILISLMGGIICYLICISFIKEETIEYPINLIGKYGTILSKGEDYYIGTLDKTNESIIVYSENEFNINEKFIISDIINGKIIINKL